MSNSPLVTYTRISPNRNSPRDHKIDTVTIHVLVAQWTAKQGCDYFASPKVKASANYVVGKDGSIGLCVEEKDRSWCTSSRSNDNRAITIEVASDRTHPYAVTDKAYAALINLLVDICKRNDIKELKWKADKSLIGKVDQQNMTVHRWFANKACPGQYLYERYGKIADTVNDRLAVKTSPNPVINPSETNSEIKVGDIVKFLGTKHYVSSNSTNGQTCKPGKAKVTALAATGKHRVHLVAVAGGGSNVYGWVDTAYIVRESPKISAGAKVKVNAGAKTYTGGKLSSFVYKMTYDVISVNGDRVVIGIGKAVTAAMNKKDLTLV